jgi:hypothetical protein
MSPPLQGRRIIQEINQHATFFHADSFIILFLDPEDGGDAFLAAVITSNSTSVVAVYLMLHTQIHSCQNQLHIYRRHSCV